MRDSEVVASIVAGDPDGLAEAYDRYADPLYKYCRSMLSDPADAADAVQDTFVVADFRLPGLRDPELLRPWLYAVARNECLRAARSRNRVPAMVPFGEAPDVTDDGVNVSADAEHAELRILIEDAARGLNPAEREVIELHLRQGLEPAEIAAMLGVSRNHVHSLLSRARDQLVECLGALLVGRAGQGECRELRGILGDWDGRLTVPLRKRVHRHIERCPICSARRAFELRPAMLLGLSPGAAVIAVEAESFRLASGAPEGLKAHTLALASGRGPNAVAHRAAVLERAGSFGRHGFPRPVHAPLAGGGRRPSRRGRVTAAAVVLAVVAAAAAFTLTGNHGRGRLGGPAPSASADVAATSGASRSPAAAATQPASPGKSATRPPSPTATPTPTTSGPTQAPSQTPPPSPTPASPSPSRSPAAGTLVVSPPGGDLTIPADGGTTITLKADGGPVSWSITLSAGKGRVSITPSSGKLPNAGSTATVAVSAGGGAVGRRLTISPGGTVLTIVSDGGNQSVSDVSATTSYTIAGRIVI